MLYNLVKLIDILTSSLWLVCMIGEHVFGVLKVAFTEWGLLWLPQACCYTIVWWSSNFKVIILLGYSLWEFLLLLSIFACARSYGELIGIRHASCIFFFAFLSMAVSLSLLKEQALYILILLRRHFPCYDAQVLQLSNMILQWNTCIYL